MCVACAEVGSQLDDAVGLGNEHGDERGIAKDPVNEGGGLEDENDVIFHVDDILHDR